MRWPIVRRSVHEQALAKEQAASLRAVTEAQREVNEANKAAVFMRVLATALSRKLGSRLRVKKEMLEETAARYAMEVREDATNSGELRIEVGPRDTSRDGKRVA